jgi:transmembrane sensor
MSDIISYRPAKRPTEEAALWRVKQMSGAMSSDERATFTHWLEASEANRIAFERLEDTLAKTDIAALTILSEKFEDELYEEPQNSTAWRMPALAASIGFVFLTLSATLFFNYSPHPQAQLYVTVVGETRSVSLDDGSIINMNTDTTLAVEYNRSERIVSFEEGEAIFNVERDKAKPFIVELPLVEIFVTGTTFSVLSSSDNTGIFVVSGTVQVKPISGQMLTLGNGDSVYIDRNGAAGSIAPFDPIDVLAWTTGKLRFTQTPLHEVVDELNRYFNKKIILRGESLSMLPVTGEFDATDQTAAIDAITLIFDLDSEINNDAFILFKKDE